MTQPDRLREAAQAALLLFDHEVPFVGGERQDAFNRAAEALRAALTEAAPAPDLLAAVERDVMRRVAGLGYKTDGATEVVARNQVYRVIHEAFSAPASREAGLDVERLAEALMSHWHHPGLMISVRHDHLAPYVFGDCSAAVAAEYARLAASPATEE